MALTSASRSWAVVARRALGTSAVAAVALVALALPASAHVPEAKASCDEKTGKTSLSVKLVKYNDKHGMNTVTITDGDKTILETHEFAENFSKTWSDLDGKVEHHFVVDVKASDDPTGKEGWTKKFTLHVKACVKEEKPPAPPAPAPQPQPQPQPAPAPPTTTTPAVGASGNLAETGASIAIPITVGAVLLVAGAGMLLLLRKRKV